MKDTYLKIFSNAEQLAGLGDLTDIEIQAIDEEASIVIDAANQFGAPDGNENSPYYVPANGDIPGYSCSGPGYTPNGWLYPIDAENGLFVILDQDNQFPPCENPILAGAKAG